jgi:hypothetical protein
MGANGEKGCVEERHVIDLAKQDLMAI